MIRFDDILEKVSSYYKGKDSTQLQKAYVFAAQAHKGQVRRSGEPYLSHPLEVANMLADMKLDVVTICSGLLHDVLEDTDVTAPELTKTFGKEITQLVEGVTKISRIQESSPEARQAESIRKIILAMTDDLRVIFIKLADRIHNLKTLKFLPQDKQKQVAQETLDIYAPIANRLGMGRIKAELEDLSFRYVSPENFFKIASLVEPLKKKAEKELDKLSKNLSLIMKKNNIPAELSSRLKRPYSIYNKMNRRKIDFEQVFDFMALRLLTDSINHCYASLGIIHQSWPHLPKRFRDLIAMPKPNLYQSLHTTIITKEQRTIEIQIRTHEMHEIAENGIAAHWKYKEEDQNHIIKEDTRLHWLREMAEFYKEQKNPTEFLENLKKHLVPEEVYVYTPKGKMVSLPLGASALDFAFKIHSEIGLHCSSVKINGKKASLKTILKSGNFVEAITSPEARPSRQWLNIAFTSNARNHIRHWLNLEEKKKNTALGKKLWKKTLVDLNRHSEKNPRNLLDSLSRLTHYRIKTVEDFYELLGSGKIVLDKKILKRLFAATKSKEKKAPLLRKVVHRVSKKSDSPLKMTAAEASLLNLAKCCNPIKGESIIGYITSGKGITIHSRRCPLVQKEILKKHRMVEVVWDKSLSGHYSGKLLIKGDDSPGLLAKLTAIIAKEEGNIKKADVLTFPDGKAQIKLTLVIRDIHHLTRIIQKITGIKEIFSVERT
ncbi:MAG: bifunctional (p)ppGpp synthetase/guanosine-3',5'-bis(diphosphate) 3'-pyrophosphohydrolase [Candidatus Aminicenantes bacterium]|nr:bifunctional (p)ppGpp synthetase/guanosine-3',5'-bis(diphosphate) 3'-pyrophosphohydrolase [Candidatus Aminicenantes bacterium]